MQVREKAAAAQPPSGQTPQDPSLAGKVGTLKLLSSKATWAIITVNFVNHWGYFIYLNWMPSYFVKALGVDLRASSFLSFLPWTVMALGSTSAGQLQCSPAFSCLPSCCCSACQNAAETTGTAKVVCSVKLDRLEKALPTGATCCSINRACWPQTVTHLCRARQTLKFMLSCLLL